jgi:regulator of RNase E activity RraB
MAEQTINIKDSTRQGIKAVATREITTALQNISKAKSGIYGIRFALKHFEANNFENDSDNDTSITCFHASCLLDGIELLSNIIDEQVQDIFAGVEAIIS